MRVLVLLANDSVPYDLWSDDRRMSSSMSLSLSAGGCNLGLIVCNLIRTSTGYPVLIPVGPGWVHGRTDGKTRLKEEMVLHYYSTTGACMYTNQRVHDRIS